MPWVIGIDEAGYGPNLGPLLQAGVALHLPETDLSGWQHLHSRIRQCHEEADERLLIDDSKKIYSARSGLIPLAKSVHTILQEPRTTLEAIIARHGVGTALADLEAEFWFQSGQGLEAEIADQNRLEGLGPIAVNLVQTPRFNAICEKHQSKAGVLAEGLITLIQHLMSAITDDEPVRIFCDKQGGRNFYAAILSTVFPDNWVTPIKETAAESRYRVEGLPREVEISFKPRADGDSVAVAIASMICKYIREISMHQFNVYWQKHLPELKPTAGYPQDAKRYLAEIEPLLPKLGIERNRLWREK